MARHWTAQALGTTDVAPRSVATRTAESCGTPRQEQGYVAAPAQSLPQERPCWMRRQRELAVAEAWRPAHQPSAPLPKDPADPTAVAPLSEAETSL